MDHFPRIVCALAVVLLFGIVAAPAAADDATNDAASTGKTSGTRDEGTARRVSVEDAESFEKQIRPLLANHCFECHGEKKQEYGLRLDLREAAMKGSDEGPVIKAGDPAGSKLIAAVRYSGEIQMPPDGKLSSEQVELLANWVARGAPWPEDRTPVPSAEETAKQHWAFQPVRAPSPPAVKQTDWVRTPVDAFILARMEVAGLGPSKAADRRTLIRRVSIDLTGLPPTPADVDEFVNDASPNAWEKVIDRLLASPRYGERWARYWLDLARYADTKGYVFLEDRAYTYAYVYRDWVIKALNDDLPYDQFLIQQIAADRLPRSETESHPNLAAMGFLTLGRRFLNNKFDIIDDRIDVVTRGTMALTVSCARCHDHKYDPIPTADYYSLFGVFDASVEKQQPIAPASEEYLKGLGEREAKIQQFLDAKRPEMEDLARKAVHFWLLAATLGPEEAKKRSLGAKLFDEAFGNRQNRRFTERWKSYLENAKAKGHPVLTPWLEFAALPEAEFAAKAAELAQRYEKNEGFKINSLVARQFATPVTSLAAAAEQYRLLFENVDEAWKQKVNEAKEKKQRDPTALDDPAAEQVRQVLYGTDSPVVIATNETEQYLDKASRDQLRGLRAEVTKWTKSPSAPVQAMTLEDAPNIAAKTRVYLRGSRDRPGPEVPRQFLSVIAGDKREPFKNGSGRLEIAQAIASPDNPLTARVIVNRVWAHHFGQGLVRTPSDFGLRSDPPSHPELLDYLAARFMAEGWSLKKLHRWILLSNAYQQSSDDRPEARAKDPENLLVWRMNRRRMDLEAMRDSLLSVGGTLDPSMGGPAVDIVKSPFSQRRSVYGHIERQNLPAFFRTFDFASPDTHSPQRFTTTVPQQALFLLNSPFVVEQAAALAKRPEIEAIAEPAERIQAMYRLLFGREPNDEERLLGVKFVSDPPADGTAPNVAGSWTKYAQALMVSNEFIFVD